jgi:hypothetical protein
LLEDCNQATISGDCNKLRKIVWVVVNCARLKLLVIPSFKYSINPFINLNAVYSHLSREKKKNIYIMESAVFVTDMPHNLSAMKLVISNAKSLVA